MPRRTRTSRTSGARPPPYAYVRHPQYDGFILIMLGLLLQWPTLLTLVMFPVLVWMYVRLARHEEREVRAEFGEALRALRSDDAGVCSPPASERAAPARLDRPMASRSPLWPSRPCPLGATSDGAGVNFALFSEHATAVELCLFDRPGFATIGRCLKVLRAWRA